MMLRMILNRLYPDIDCSYEEKVLNLQEQSPVLFYGLLYGQLMFANSLMNEGVNVIINKEETEHAQE